MLRRTTFALVFWTLLFSSLLSLMAPGASAQAPPSPFLGERVRSELGSLQVQDFQGRIKPLDTMAREMVQKITREPGFRGYEALDFYLSWSTHDAYWYRQPIIAVQHSIARAVYIDDMGVFAQSFPDNPAPTSFKSTIDVVVLIRRGAGCEPKRVGGRNTDKIGL